MTEKTDQTEANRYPPLRPTPHARALVQARARMSKAWARANETMAEFFELDGRPEDAREARKAAKAEWREAAKDDREALKLIESGEGHVVIGTHSLISDDVVFKSLGLAVVDEQHRFGVEQRAALASKGEFLFIPVWSTSMTMCFVYRARGRYGSAG